MSIETVYFSDPTPAECYCFAVRIIGGNLDYNWMRIKKQVLNPHQSTFKGLNFYANYTYIKLTSSLQHQSYTTGISFGRCWNEIPRCFFQHFGAASHHLDGMPRVL